MKNELLTHLGPFVERRDFTPDEMAVLMAGLSDLSARNADRLLEFFTRVYDTEHQLEPQEVAIVQRLLLNVGIPLAITNYLIAAIDEQGRLDQERLKPITFFADAHTRALIELAVGKLELFGLMYKINFLPKNENRGKYANPNEVVIEVKPIHIPHGIDARDILYKVIEAGRRSVNAIRSNWRGNPQIDFEDEDIRGRVKYAMGFAAKREIGNA